MKTIHLVTGSTLGGAEYVADHLDSVLSEQGFTVKLFNQASLSDIQTAQHLIVVTSTYGAGELPENLQPLFDEIRTQTPDLATLKFGVVGLGSSDYDTFCQAVEIVSAQLKASGANEVCEALKIDVVHNFDHDGTAQAWLPSFLQKI